MHMHTRARVHTAYTRMHADARRKRGVSENWETTFRETITGFRYFEIASSALILARHARIIIPNNASVSFGWWYEIAFARARARARLRKVTWTDTLTLSALTRIDRHVPQIAIGGNMARLLRNNAAICALAK